MKKFLKNISEYFNSFPKIKSIFLLSLPSVSAFFIYYVIVALVISFNIPFFSLPISNEPFGFLQFLTGIILIAYYGYFFGIRQYINQKQHEMLVDYIHAETLTTTLNHFLFLLNKIEMLNDSKDRLFLQNHYEESLNFPLVNWFMFLDYEDNPDILKLPSLLFHVSEMTKKFVNDKHDEIHNTAFLNQVEKIQNLLKTLIYTLGVVSALFIDNQFLNFKQIQKNEEIQMNLNSIMITLQSQLKSVYDLEL